MNLSELKPPAGAHKSTRRVGRGPGCGSGKTSGRGHKGQHARSGSKRRAWMEGGQMRIYRRLPKRGFHNPAHVEYQVINLSDLAGANLADRVDIDGLHELRLVRTKVNPVKILGTGTIDRPLHIVAHAFSKSAQEKIAAAGGTCEWVNPPVEPIEAHHHGKHKKSAVDASKDDAGDANTKDTTS